MKIEWEKPVDLGRGGYARIHPLADGRLMAAYSAGGGIVARFASRDNLKEWSDPVVVARDFVVTKGVEAVRVSLANAEFAQLETGRIIYACNLRPRDCRHDIAPFAVAISASDDSGRTWSPLKVIYRPKVALPVDGRPHGCYEPFILPLKGDGAQVYFADESPYVKAQCAWQNISFMETHDNGETWSGPRVACYTPGCRDGMPVLMDSGKWRYLAIEANPGKTKLHPQIVRVMIRDNWRTPVLYPSPDRFEPLAGPPDWERTYGGAPYMVATENFILMSWQESSYPGDPVKTSIARVAAVPKKEVSSNGIFSTMRAVSTPPGMEIGKDRMLWNSLCYVYNDRFLLVSEVKGRIKIYPGVILEGSVVRVNATKIGSL